MDKVSNKRNLSSMQVLKTLQILMEDNYSMQELIEKLNRNEEDAIFNNSIISKYINTCRYLGFEIPKINNKYYVTKLPFGMEFSDIDINLIKNLYNIARNEMANKSFRIFDNLIEKINRFANKKIVRVDKDSYQFSYELFEQAIKKKRKINLIFRNRAKLECIPLCIVDSENKTFFKVYNKRERMIDINRLSGIEVLDEQYQSPYKNEPIIVVYKLKNKLAQRYELRENETLISFNGDTKVIQNQDENQEELLSRLLRYDVDCEIIKPQSYRDSMKKLLEDALSNYGINK